jgi:hypothetical protein
MVFFEDTGAVLDAPIDRVWKYLTSPEHGPAHAGSARNFEVRETIGRTAVVAAERRHRGSWSKFVSHSTDFPPLCTVNEEVEGEFAGTRFVVVYRPEGNVTRVDVFGDVRSPVYAEVEARRLFLELMQGAYEDDEKAIRLLRSQGKL